MYFGGVNVLDVIVLIALAYGCIRGAIKGFVVEVAGVIALVLGLLGAFRYSALVENYVSQYVSWNPKLLFSLSFLLIFVVIIYIISLLAKGVTKTLKIVALGWLNRLLGGAFGMLKWTLIFSAFTLIIIEANTIFTFIPETYISESQCFSILKEFGLYIYEKIQLQPADFNQQII